MQLLDGAADTACRCIVFAFSGHVQQMPGAGCALHQQRSCILVASIDLCCSTAAPPLKHSASDALIKVSRDLDHCRQAFPVPGKDDWQKVACMSCEGVTGRLRAPTLEMDIKQVEVGHLADFRANSCNPKRWFSCPMSADGCGFNGSMQLLDRASECRACPARSARWCAQFLRHYLLPVLKPASTSSKAMLPTLVVQKESSRILNKGLVQRFSPRSHAGSLRLPSAVQTYG